MIGGVIRDNVFFSLWSGGGGSSGGVFSSKQGKRGETLSNYFLESIYGTHTLSIML